MLKDYKMKILMREYLESIIERIIAIDKNDHSYLAMLCEPWLHENTLPANSYNLEAWKKIFISSKS